MATKKKAAAPKKAVAPKKQPATKTAAPKTVKTKSDDSKPGRSAFPPGALDKSGRHVRTATGWVPVKGNEKLVNMDLEVNKGREMKVGRKKEDK